MFLLCSAGLGTFIYAQPPSNNKRVIDSLQRELAHARHDTDRIKLRYRIGMAGGITRIGYWDSLNIEAQDNHLPVYACRSLNQLGLIYYQQLHNDDKSEEYLGSSIRIAEESGNKQEMLLPILCIAVEQNNHFNNRKSIDFCFRGLKIAEEINNKTFEARFTKMIASIYRTTGQPEKALPMEFKALGIFRSLNNNTETAGVLFDIGTIYEQIKDEKNTVKYYLACEKYARELGETIFAGELYVAVGAAYNIKKEFDKARSYFLKAHNISKALGALDGQASALSLLAYNSFLKGDMKSAEKEALQGLELARSINMIPQIPALANTLRRVYIQNKNYAKALEFYTLQVTLQDSAANEEKRQENLKKQFEYDFEKKETQNKLLTQQNQIQLLKLQQDNYLIGGLGIIIVFILSLSWLLIKQNKIRSAQQGIEMERKLLHAQMNPNFIFNSLQEIQGFILNQQRKEAVKYLSLFADVTRAVLESSRMELISLKREISLLENYLLLQSNRLGDTLTYSIHIDEEIDLKLINIPPMLAYPFIENAVEHGMPPSDEVKRINIAYTLKEGLLCITITHNCPGQQLKNNSGDPGRSQAIEITRERIDLLNKKERQKIRLSFSENYSTRDGQNEMKIVFSLPLRFKTIKQPEL